MEYKVSVVMPVYNAEKYIERAIESVVHLPATGEVLMIDDASADNSLALCKQLAAKYPKLRLIQHGDKKNHGAAASRNLGMASAACDYISFLDADDYYMPNRFAAEEKIFEMQPNTDGVYGFTLAEYESENAKEIFSKGYIAERTTFSKAIPSAELFKALVFGGYGCFHTSGITFKKALLAKTGMFNPKIRYVEDTELWYKFSLLGNLAAGSIDTPVAIRWVHDNNSIHESDNIRPYRQKMNKEIFDWGIKKIFLLI